MKSVCHWTCVLLCFSGTLMAQSTFGTVLGTVKDPSGALIPAAESRSCQYRNERSPIRDSGHERRVSICERGRWNVRGPRGCQWLSESGSHGIRAWRPANTARRHHFAARFEGDGSYRRVGHFSGDHRRLERGRDEREPGIERPSGGHRHASKRIDQRLLNPDLAARSADRCQQQYLRRRISAVADHILRGRDQLGESGQLGRSERIIPFLQCHRRNQSQRDPESGRIRRRRGRNHDFQVGD